MIYSFHIQFPIFDFICQSLLQEIFYLNIFYRTSFHRQQIIFFINPAPVNNHIQFFFQKQIQPASGTSAISLAKRMCNVQLYLFFNNFIKCRLRHLFKILNCSFQIHNRRKSKISFCHIYFSNAAMILLSPNSQSTSAPVLHAPAVSDACHPAFHSGFPLAGDPLTRCHSVRLLLRGLPD